MPSAARSVRNTFCSTDMREQKDSHLETTGHAARGRRRRERTRPQAGEKEVVELFDGGGRGRITL